MASPLEYYYYLMETKGDPRTNEWFLMSSPGPLLTIIATYLYFCVWAGPNFMKDRKPFEMKGIIKLYNLVQVILSVLLVYEGLQGGWGHNYSFACQPIDFSEDPRAKRMAGAVYFYFICKLTELLDTVFFVLRKKMNQVSFLHLYHHSLMPVCAWVGAKFLPGGHGTLLGLINSFIHIIMYSYYLVASLGPQYQKYLWWKKYLTAMQMVQFCIIAVHNFQVLFRQCDYPKFIAFLLGMQAIFFFYLFGSFYYRTYVKPTHAPPPKEIVNAATTRKNSDGDGSAVTIANGTGKAKKTKAN
ncbi:very long chain fatty acid elongase AAEL008004-like [Atheta coriaria]|uniref:very long chain fatty acid elongase AAEL008004-like n=1 Tax=Dalotia coriaria TaxID=877792 RepID=UPI0031F46C51